MSFFQRCDMDNPQRKVQSIILCLFGYVWLVIFYGFYGSTMCKWPCCSNIWGSKSKSQGSKFLVALRTLGDPKFSLGPRQEKQSPARKFLVELKEVSSWKECEISCQTGFRKQILKKTLNKRTVTHLDIVDPFGMSVWYPLKAHVSQSFLFSRVPSLRIWWEFISEISTNKGEGCFVCGPSLVILQLISLWGQWVKQWMPNLTG